VNENVREEVKNRRSVRAFREPRCRPGGRRAARDEHEADEEIKEAVEVADGPS
jgi:hypothetical protein